MLIGKKYYSSKTYKSRIEAIKIGLQGSADCAFNLGYMYGYKAACEEIAKDMDKIDEYYKNKYRRKK